MKLNIILISISLCIVCNAECTTGPYDVLATKTQGTSKTLSPLPIRIINDEKDALHTKDREEKTDKFNDTYLQTQVITAESANIQKWTSMFQTTMGIIGVIFVYFTYRETRKTAQASIDASRSAEKAAKIAELSLNHSERAWIGLDKLQLTNDLKAEENFEINYIVKNFGRAPALNVRKVFEWRIEPTSKMDNFNIPKIPDNSEVTVILPNASATFHPFVNMSPISTEQFNNIMNGTDTLLVMSVFEYEDSFANKHITQERYYYKVNRKSFGPTQKGNYAT
ncbi:MAG TPA: hypothetical protein VK448_07585 [Dissulfurispiraceae bacterium]|nr:hypothetical protein [Dissulfurispiraceae bacterium]